MTELELHIYDDPYSSLSKRRRRVFGKSGGTVGRALDNYWLLPDPKFYLSGHHCEIFYRKGSFWIRDTSRNGVFVNGSKHPLGYGHKTRLSDGDALALATYKVRVKLRRAAVHAGSVSHEREAPAPEDDDPDDDRSAEHHGSTGEHERPGETQQVSEQPEPAAEALADAAAPEPAPQPADAVTLDPPPSPADEAEDVNVTDTQDVTDEAEAASAEEATDAEDAAPESAGTPGERVEPEDARGNASADESRLAQEDQSISDGPGESPESEAIILETRTLDPALLESDAPGFVHIDRERLQAEGHLPPKKIERLINNQFRHIKRPVIKNALGKGVEPAPNGNLIMVTSSLPGEGKSFSSINLAFSMAREKDLDVVLIDADVARKTISGIFGINDHSGLLDALADDELDVESLILETDVPGLQLLPAGHCDEEDLATELLASSRMDDIAMRLAARSPRRILLFDSSPLLLTNESRVLASIVGQVLLVVREGETPQQAVMEAIGFIDEDKPLGLVLNQSKAHAPGGYYGYGSYGYGVYGEDSKKES